MIISVWKPMHSKSKITHYTLVNNNDIYNKGTTGYKVLWKCDNEDCKYKDKLHSIGRHHLNVNRSVFCYEDVQICHPCQFTGKGNPRYGDNRTWTDMLGKERSDKLKKTFSNRWINDNPSKLDDIKIKKGQIIINFENVNNLLLKEDFLLLKLDGCNKYANLKVKCPNNHLYETRYVNWSCGKRCQRCFYDSIMISDDQIEKYEKYCNYIRSLTRQTYKINKQIIDPYNKQSKLFHIDHIYSIYDGFKNNIDPIILSSIYNLRLITREENSKKGGKSDMTLEELLEKYNSSL